MFFSDMYCDRRISQDVRHGASSVAGSTTLFCPFLFASCQTVLYSLISLAHYVSKPIILALQALKRQHYPLSLILQLRSHPVLLSEGLGGSLYVNDFLRLAREVR